MSSAFSCSVLETASAACVVGVGCVNARKANEGKDLDVGHFVSPDLCSKVAGCF